MSDQQQPEWRPAEEKWVRMGVTGLIWAAVIFGGALLIKAFVPTIADAVALLQTLLANAITTTLTAMGLAAVLWLAYETFSKNGRINKVFALAYDSFIRNLTMAVIDADPMSPLRDSLENVKEKKATYDEQFAQFDGQISTFRASEEDFRARAAQAEKRAKAAAARGDQKAFDRLSYQVGSATETANNLASMRQRLEPIRAIIVRMQEYAGDLIYKLEIDIENTEVTWKATKSMSKMERAARGILSNNGKSELAREAQRLVQTKYATAIGRLENLNDLAMPLLQNVDLDKAAYSQDLLAKWEAEARGAAIPLTITSSTPVPAPALGDFSKLIDQ